MLDVRLGRRIKEVRKGRRMTLQELSQATGLSVSYLSMLERGRSSPTVANLQRICRTVDITFHELLASLEDDKLYVPKEQRRQIFQEEDGSVLYEAISEGNRCIKSICMTVFDQEEHESARHIADESGFVVSGSMVMMVDGVSYQLHAGDSLYIPANSLHSFRKSSEEPCVSIWSCCNAALEEIAGYPAAAGSRSTD